MKISSANKQIAAQVRASGTSFYWPMHLQKPRFRHALFTIYMYCRELDDIADSTASTNDKIRGLSTWRENIDTLFSAQSLEGKNKNPLMLTLAQNIERFDLPKSPFLALINGMEADVTGPILAPSWPALRIYCHQVAGAVGELCLAVWGWRGADADRFARLTGEALQLTNILRDVKEDAKIGRLYLPVEALHQAEIEARTPAGVIEHPAFPHACENVANETRKRFLDAEACWAEASVPHARPAWVMLQLYKALFFEVTRIGFEPDYPRARLSVSQKFFHLARAYVTA